MIRDSGHLIISTSAYLCIEDVIKQFSDGPIIEDDNLKCYMDCMFGEMGVKKADGKIDMVAVHESFNEDNEIHMTFIHMVRLCLYPTGANDCEIAYSMHKCWKQKDPKVCTVIQSKPSHPSFLFFFSH